LRDYANTIHRTPLIAVVAVVMRPRPDAARSDATGAVVGRGRAWAAKEGMPLGDMMARGAVKCCGAASCS
jgi:hypothetical protein